MEPKGKRSRLKAADMTGGIHINPIFSLAERNPSFKWRIYQLICDHLNHPNVYLYKIKNSPNGLYIEPSVDEDRYAFLKEELDKGWDHFVTSEKATQIWKKDSYLLTVHLLVNGIWHFLFDDKKVYEKYACLVEKICELNLLCDETANTPNSPDWFNFDLMNIDQDVLRDLFQQKILGEDFDVFEEVTIQG